MKCHMPWTRLSMGAETAWNCCYSASSSPLSHQNIKGETSLWNIWNSQSMITARKEMMEHGYPRACGHDSVGGCVPPPAIGCDGWDQASWLTEDQRSNITAAKESFEAGEFVVRHYPVAMDIVLGLRCNLRCVMCNEEPARRLLVIDEYNFPLEERGDTLREFLHWGSRVIITGGEPSVCPSFEPLLSIMRDAGGAKATVCTNGQLVREIILPHRDQIEALHLSVDAASRETYEKIRVGGDWGKMVLGLEAVSEAMRDGSLPFAYMFNVISKWNYHEMPEMVKLSASLGMPYLKFDEVREEPGMNIPELKFRPEDEQMVIPFLERAIEEASKTELKLEYSFHTFKRAG